MSSDDQYVVSDKPKLTPTEKVEKLLDKLGKAVRKEHDKSNKDFCNKDNNGSFACSRPIGHAGMHIAVGSEVVSVWE